MNKKDYKQGYKDAIGQLKKMLEGKSSSGQSDTNTPSSSNSGNSSSSSANQNKQQSQNKGSDGQSMQTPQLNEKDQKIADRNAKKQEKLNQGNSQASDVARDAAAASGTSMGGWVDQDNGVEISKSEGYEGESIKKLSDNELSKVWQEATIEACNNNNNPGLGNIVSKLRKLRLTSHDWKSELKKYIGRALNTLDTHTKYGKRKWLAYDDIKKYDADENETQLDVIFMIDCSSSLSDDLLNRLMDECYTIVKKKGIEDVMYCYYDDGIRQIDYSKKLSGIGDDIEFNIIKKGMPSGNIHGRGGNYEQHSLDDLLKISKKSHQGVIQLVMWFTDGYCSNIPPRPRKQIKNMIWVVYSNESFKVEDDSKLIFIDPNDIEK